MNDPLSPLCDHYVKPLLLFIVLVVIAGHLYNYNTKDGYPYPFEYGLYNWEEWGEKNDKRKMRWTWKSSCLRTTAEADILGFRVFAAPYNIDENGLELKIFIDDALADRVHFVESGHKLFYYYFPGMSGRNINLRTKVSRTFNPSKLGINQDTRDLGVAVSPVTFLRIMPTDGVGFYDWELWGEGKSSGMPDDLPPRFRWTGMQASINVQREFKEGGTLFLSCAHPDIDEDQVLVEIMSDGDLIRRETFTDNRWKKIAIKTEEVEGSKALTLRVSRTWNPRLEGVSNDSRELGVAVAY